MTVTLRIQAEHPGLRPVVSEQIIIEAVTGSAGASLEDRVLGGSFEPMIGTTGVLEVDLEPVDVHGEPVVYRVTVGGEVRHLDLSEVAEDATVDWSDDAYLVVDTSELPPSWTPIVGPAGPAGAAGPQGAPGVVAATGLATYDAETQTIDVTATAADVDAVPVTAVGLLAGERNRGDWDNATAYLPGDVVHDHSGDGNIYRANAANIGEQPSLGLGSWDVIDPAERSVALGLAAEAGAAAAAVGSIAAASGVASTAVGFGASTSNEASTAIGHGASASGVGSTAIGGEASASGLGSTAIGGGVSATEAGEVNVGNIFHGRYDYDGAAPVAASIATGFVDLPETVDATNPAADHQRLVARTDGLYVRNESGTEVGPLGAGGGGGLMQSIGYTSGGIYGLLGNAASVNCHLAAAAGRWVAHPIWLPAGNYAGLSVLSTVAAVATWRLGIYHGTPEGATTLLHDCGTVDTNATPGSLLASSAFTIATTGLYWVAVLVDAHTTAPTVWSYRGSVGDIPALPYLGARLGAAAAVRSYFARYASSVSTGSMPATAPTQTLTDQPPLIRVHAA